jgi:hypothetical protein
MVISSRGNVSSPDVQQSSSKSMNTADEMKQLKSTKNFKVSGLMNWLNRKKMRKMKYSNEVDGEDSKTINYVEKANLSKSGVVERKAGRDGAAGEKAAVHWSLPMEKKTTSSTPQKVDIIECSTEDYNTIGQADDDDDDDDDDIDICCSPTSCFIDDSFATVATSLSPWSSNSSVDIDRCRSPTSNCVLDDLATSFSPWSSSTSWNPNFFQEEDLS